MFVGALLDGIPEAFILGSTIALGGGISIAFVAAVFVSNIPQGVAGTTSLQDAGYSSLAHLPDVDGAHGRLRRGRRAGLRRVHLDG